MREDQPLGSLGERAIIEELLRPRYESKANNFGDDCASILLDGTAGSWLVATTDPCPHPAASLLGYSDYYYWGWLLGTINLSDIAASGGTPVGVLSSLILPSTLTVGDLNCLLDGLDECCGHLNTNVIGGNLKEGPTISLGGTALGVSDGLPMTRKGAQVDDVLLAVGDLGRFWAGYLASSRELTLPDDDLSYLLRGVLQPVAKVGAGRRLRLSGFVHSCLDNSDGLYPSLLGLTAGGLGAVVDFDQISFSQPVRSVAGSLNIDPARFVLGWGDWQLIAAVDPEHVDDVLTEMRIEETPACRIGVVTDSGMVECSRGGARGQMMPLDSQRFSSDSWFTAGIEAYIDKLLMADLLQ